MTETENGRPNHEILVKVDKLKMHFPIRRGLLKRQIGTIRAVDDINLEVYKGETLGLVGEGGCGKSTVGRTILLLHQPTAGKVFFAGDELTKLNREQLRRTRRHMQIIFQDPYTSLNPRMTIGEIISEPLSIHNIGNDQSRQERVKELLSLVGLNPYFINRYPHEFSGGQRQRIGIARALATNPSFIVVDEPISALDISIQTQVINLLANLKQKLGLTYLFITHDLSIVRYISDRVAVMYLGKIVEFSSREDVFNKPLHPYTQALLSANPLSTSDKEGTRKRLILAGDVPKPDNPPSGCRFHPHCTHATEICRTEEPVLRPLGKSKPAHQAACHHAENFL